MHAKQLWLRNLMPDQAVKHRYYDELDERGGCQHCLVRENIQLILQTRSCIREGVIWKKMCEM